MLLLLKVCELIIFKQRKNIVVYFTLGSFFDIPKCKFEKWQFKMLDVFLPIFVADTKINSWPI